MQTTEPTSVHGHEVIDLILSADPLLSRAELAAEVRRRFGPDARFHTCSAAGMTLEHLLMFLLARQKVVERDGRLSVLAENICKH